MFFSNEHQIKLLNQIYQVLIYLGVLIFRYCMHWRMYWYLPPVCIFLFEENLTKKIEKDSEKGHFNVIFEKTSKKLLKQNWYHSIFY